MLRRSKAGVESQLQLPPCERIDTEVVLPRVQRAFYDSLKKDFQQVDGCCKPIMLVDEATCLVIRPLH